MATTVVNSTPATVDSSDRGMGFFLGVVLLLIVAGAFFMYGLPMIYRNSGGGASTGSSTGSQINVPDHMNVNIQHSTTGK